MAIYNVQSDGNAPTGAKSGDYVVTAGGTYQVLDSSKYTGKSKEDLASAGVSYNPSSGLYSKKISSINSNEYSALGTENLDNWRTQKNASSTAQLDSAYQDNKKSLTRTYNNSLSDYNQQQADIKQSYLDNITQLYNDTYYNNAKAIENASNRGLTSSGLGNAMSVSSLVDASNKNAYYRASRDNDLNKITSAINELTNNYNVDLDALDAKLASDKTAALSENEASYLNALMELEQYNSQTYNSLLSTKQQQEWQELENEKDRELQKYLAELSASSSYGSGYSYGGYGGYGGYSGYSGYSKSSGNSSSSSSSSSSSTSSESSSYRPHQLIAANYVSSSSKLSSAQRKLIMETALNNPNPTYTKMLIQAVDSGHIGSNGKPVTSTKTSSTSTKKTSSTKSSSSTKTSTKKTISNNATNSSRAQGLTYKAGKTSTLKNTASKVKTTAQSKKK